MKNNEQENLQEDLDKYKIMCDIADRLVEVSSSKRALGPDDGNLVEFLNNQERVDALLNKLDNSNQVEKHLKYILESDKERDTLLLFSKLEKVKKQHRIILFKKIASTAAALIISFCIFYIISEPDEAVNVVQTRTNTHYDVPVIVLSDGEKIDLISASGDSTAASKNITFTDTNAVKYSNELVIGAEKDVCVEYNTIIIPAKQSFNVELADGTVVTLNANSSLKFPVNFSGSQRTVELNGEAYFKVAKSSKPFVVMLDNSSVKVYGTEFNINMNKEHTIETILIEGSIGFTVDKEREIMMQPNQLMKMNKTSYSCEVSYVDVNKYLGWKNGCFLYEQESLRVILNDIASWYGVRFSIENKVIGSTELSINLNRSMKLSDLLSKLEKMLNVKFINEGRNTYIVL